MRNKIITIILLVLLVLIIVAMISGINIGRFQILSIAQLKEKNNNLNSKLEEATRLTSVKYPDAIDDLEEAYEKQQIQKQKYEELSDFGNIDEKSIYETKQYDIGYLWRIFGKYASKYNLTIGMDVKKTTGENLYDLYFNVSGEYTNIINFISSIEENSDLYFRIYNFKMSGSSEKVASTFNVKGVNIDPSTIKNSTVSTEETTNNIFNKNIEDSLKSDKN